MRVRKQDTSGDYTLGTPADFYVNAPDGVAQAAMTRLRLFTGEWFIDTGDGTPWRTEVLGKFTRGAYDTIIKQRVLGTPGVRAILGYESAFDGSARQLTVSFILDTIYGPAVVRGTI